jgi:hypothetical protein
MPPWVIAQAARSRSGPCGTKEHTVALSGDAKLAGSPEGWDPPAEPPAWLDAVDRPILLVSTSSEFQDDGRLARCALEATAGRKG